MRPRDNIPQKRTRIRHGASRALPPLAQPPPGCRWEPGNHLYAQQMAPKPPVVGVWRRPRIHNQHNLISRQPQQHGTEHGLLQKHVLNRRNDACLITAPRSGTFQNLVATTSGIYNSFESRAGSHSTCKLEWSLVNPHMT